MHRYAVRALPWPLIGLATVLLVGMILLVRQYAWTLWPLQGMAVGLVAAIAGWCLDEPAAAVVDAAPRGLLWRTSARLTGIAVLLAAWTVAVWWAGDALFDHPGAVLVQGYCAAAIGCSWATWRRTRGEATPGYRWAVVVVPLVTAWALLRPAETRLPVFPYGPAGPTAQWTASTAGWIVSAAGAVIVAAGAVLSAGRTPVRASGTPEGARRAYRSPHQS